MKYSISLESLKVDARIGILPHELARPQPIAVSAHLNLAAFPEQRRPEDISEVLDYRKVRQLILDETASGHFNLVETLAERIAQRMLALKFVTGVRIKVSKFAAFPDCDSVAVELEHDAT
jgi:7,8-dihydroneopterin aldolase/epimerase/oxygenase